MTLILRPALRAALGRQLAAAYPEEGCGILFGRERDGVREVREARPARNVARRRRRGYRIAPLELVDALRAAQARGDELLGFYHSHPDAPPTPSRRDRAEAWPAASYLIAEVRTGALNRLRSWRLLPDGADWEAEPLRARQAARKRKTR